MIFVSVGTHETPFDRMLRAVECAGPAEDVVVQHGPSLVRVRDAVQAEYLSFDEVVQYVRSARAVVTHAGVGSVMIALANGKRPIVMPRLHAHGEHVDDHQLQLARRLEAHGLVTVVDDEASLARALAEDSEPAAELDGMPWLGDDLGTYLAETIAPAREAS
jgi:UDP-N-acetylglucosamine transferase subunit ALG13